MYGGCEVRSCRHEGVWEEGLVALLPAEHRLAGKAALAWTDLAGEHLLVPQGTDGPLLDPWLTEQVAAGDRGPIIEQCQACQATIVLKIQIGKGFTVSGASFAEGVSIDRTVWRPIVGPISSGIISAVWLDTNPKRAALHLLAIARNLAAERDQAPK